MRSYAFFLLLTLLAGLAPVTTLRAGEVQIVTLAGDPWPPYITGELGSQASGGLGVELMRAIFDRLEGTRLSVPLVPWNRALREVQRGTKDGIGILLKTPEREEYLVYTDELFRSYNVVWYSAKYFPNGFDWNTYADFKPYSIGVIAGHSYGTKLDKMISERTLAAVEVSSARQLFAMLEKGRVDFAIADRLVGDAFVEEYAGVGERLLAAKKRAAGEVFYIAFSKKSKARHLIPELNRIVAELREEGVIQRLVEKRDTTRLE